jgi:hypothetical protein
MKSSEFRIGNLVEYNLSSGAFDDDTELNPLKIITIGAEDCFHNYVRLSDGFNNSYDFDEIKPIHLTDEWMIKFGFIAEDKRPSKDHGQYFSKPIYDYKYSFAYAHFRNDWGFYHSYTDAPNEEDNNKYDLISCDIKYVHQLQNLYFALTGEELEIKY